MMSRTRNGLSVLCMTIALCLIAQIGLAQLTTEKSVAVSIEPNNAETYLAPPNARYVLSIAGPNGFNFQEEFERGSAPTLSAHYAESGVLANGAYTYELRVVPEVGSEIENAFKMARETGDMSEIEEMKAEGTLPRFAVITSGNFTVESGNILNRAEREYTADPEDTLSAEDIPITVADVCYYDDLIVDGSLCVGFDCTCNYSFGFDTIVLKENNLRIFFDDTSVAASFPRNDWRIVINDSANGGASYFGVEDSTGGRRVFTLEAGAPSHSLYVDDGGRVGMGTSTPSVEIHTVDGDTPTLRLQQDGSSGFAPQTWDVAGNETNFFVRDVTGGSTLPLRIRPGAPTSSIDIASDGDVGIGTASPDQDLDIESSDDDGATFRLTNTGPVSSTWDFHASGANGNLFVSDDGGAFSRTPLKIATGANNNLLRIGIPATDTVEINGILSVNGSVVVDSTTVHPDYVFDPTYELMPLNELADFVAKNRHLPNVQSTKERQENHGRIVLSEIPLQLLEKVEELTLYTINQQQHIDRLSVENAGLLKRIEELERNE